VIEKLDTLGLGSEDKDASIVLGHKLTQSQTIESALKDRVYGKNIMNDKHSLHSST
jgi:hypothetical protein